MSDQLEYMLQDELIRESIGMIRTSNEEYVESALKEALNQKFGDVSPEALQGFGSELIHNIVESASGDLHSWCVNDEVILHMIYITDQMRYYKVSIEGGENE